MNFDLITIVDIDKRFHANEVSTSASNMKTA